MRLKKGQLVLIEVTIVRKCYDTMAKKGYVVQTSRGSLAYVDTEDIYIKLKEKKDETTVQS